MLSQCSRMRAACRGVMYVRIQAAKTFCYFVHKTHAWPPWQCLPQQTAVVHQPPTSGLTPSCNPINYQVCQGQKVFPKLNTITGIHSILEIKLMIAFSFTGKRRKGHN